MVQLEGGCLCQHVRYRINGEPNRAAICHCRSCQLSAGAESVGWAVLDREQLEFIVTEPRKYCSSPGVERTFCAECGTTLTYQHDSKTTIDITLASLDNPEAVQPSKEIWCSHRLSWNALDINLEHRAD